MDFTDALNAISDYKGLDAEIVDKMEELEKGLLWRMYYFSGGVTKRWISGIGIDTDLIHYDGITGDRDLFAEYNPRYLDEYVIQSRQNGWYNHLIYSNGVDVKHTTLSNIAQTLSFVKKNGEYFGMIAAMIFFDKLDLFVENYDFDKQSLLNDLNSSRKQSLYDRMLEQTIGVTKRQFQEDSRGWLATDERFCFAADIWEKYKSMKEEYDIYRERLWNEISSKPCFQICSNVVKGTFVGNITITQVANCEMNMVNSGCASYSNVEKEDKPDQNNDHYLWSCILI